MEFLSSEKLAVLLVGEQPMLEQSVPEGLHAVVQLLGWFSGQHMLLLVLGVIHSIHLPVYSSSLRFLSLPSFLQSSRV